MNNQMGQGAWKEVPEWWKDHFKIKHVAKGRSKDWAMPVEMQKAFDRLMGEYSVGSSCVTPNGTNVIDAHIVKTLKTFCPCLQTNGKRQPSNDGSAYSSYTMKWPMDAKSPK